MVIPQEADGHNYLNYGQGLNGMQGGLAFRELRR